MAQASQDNSLPPTRIAEIRCYPQPGGTKTGGSKNKEPQTTKKQRNNILLRKALEPLSCDIIMALTWDS